MYKIFGIVILCISWCTSIRAQEILYDSAFENEVLPTGHFIDEESVIYTEAYKKGLKLLSYELSECDKGTDPYQFLNTISAIDTVGDSLIFHFELSLNCCMGTSLTVELVDSNTWNFHLIERDDEGGCFCNCCFSSYITVENLTGRTPIRFQLNGDSIGYNPIRVEAVYDEIKYWENGKIHTYTKYRTQSHTRLMRLTYDGDGKLYYTEYFNEKGVVVRKRYHVEKD